MKVAANDWWKHWMSVFSRIIFKNKYPFRKIIITCSLCKIATFIWLRWTESLLRLLKRGSLKDFILSHHIFYVVFRVNGPLLLCKLWVPLWSTESSLHKTAEKCALWFCLWPCISYIQYIATCRKGNS